MVQRLHPEPDQPAVFTTELPAPERPDLEYFFDSVSAADAKTLLSTFALQARDELALTGASAEQLHALHDLGTRLDESTPGEARLSLVNGVFDSTRQLLGQAQYARYLAALHRVGAAALLAAPTDASAEQGL